MNFINHNKVVYVVTDYYANAAHNKEVFFSTNLKELDNFILSDYWMQKGQYLGYVNVYQVQFGNASPKNINAEPTSVYYA